MADGHGSTAQATRHRGFHRQPGDGTDRMTWQVLAMIVVAAAFAILGGGLLLLLLRRPSPTRVYVYRMVGIMALAAAVVLAFSASAMQQWSVAGQP